MSEPPGNSGFPLYPAAGEMAEKKLKLVRLAYIKYEEALNRSRFSMIRL